MSQTTEHRVHPATALAIRLVVGLALSRGPLRGVSLPPLFFLEKQTSAPPYPPGHFHLSLPCRADGAQNAFAEKQYKAKTTNRQL